MADITAAHYFAGTIGLAIIRHWYHDGAHDDARLAELRPLLDALDEFPNSLLLNPQEHDLTSGYAEWAGTYDGPNPLIEAEEPRVHTILDRLVAPGRTALDAACGTGRHAAHLAELGAVVTGVDRSPEMLTSHAPRCRAPPSTLATSRHSRTPTGRSTWRSSHSRCATSPTLRRPSRSSAEY